LIYSIIRQESEFASEAVSYSGAVGMMQIMPNTAKMLSRQEKLKYDLDQLLEDSSYNIQLGNRYISDLVREFDGSYTRAIASYNAGPNRIKQWNKNNTTDNVLDWIELIPFKETRYYVKNVLRNVQFYRILLNSEDNKFNILNDLERGTASEDS
jgi:soluble lytic murein transglycosylase